MRPTCCRGVLWGIVLIGLSSARALVADEWITFEGSKGPGAGKQIVLVSGDEEYRSEEGLPQLAKILAEHHGFRCTVLFAIDPDRGTIDPNRRDNIPGLDSTRDADLLVIATRFRDLPDDQMEPIARYVESGRPIVGLRTATHAFDIKPGRAYARYGWKSQEPGWEGGFGRRVLGETWINHHGSHGKQSTRGLIAPGMEDHSILRGIDDGDIWGDTDVYGVRLPLPGDSKPLVLGQVLAGMQPTDPPLEGPKNDPMMPIAWTRTYDGGEGKSGRAFATTMGSSRDLLSEGLRRLLVNGCYWAVGLEDQIPEKSEVELVGDYQPNPFGNNGFRKDTRPAEHSGR